ncbi:hypothetical protein LT85_2018 [Collimonas arenae]|uniref:Uncharacterized protein n=1 Tax=Collimonas arenae TaxID=279058 RepID=A0A0A1F9I4_9BURK|nr:hypothetical protein LT85_2018 [Collimonas arenae]
MYTGQPLAKVDKAVWNRIQCRNQSFTGLTKLAQLKRTKNIDRTNNGCYCQSQNT